LPQPESVALTTGSDYEPSHNDWPISQIPAIISPFFGSTAFAGGISKDVPIAASKMQERLVFISVWDPIQSTN
jgi:hypothetical protein